MVCLACSASADVKPVVSDKANVFPLYDVRLLDGPFKEAMLRDGKYLLEIEPDRLLLLCGRGAALHRAAAGRMGSATIESARACGGGVSLMYAIHQPMSLRNQILLGRDMKTPKPFACSKAFETPKARPQCLAFSTAQRPLQQPDGRGLVRNLVRDERASVHNSLSRLTHPVGLEPTTLGSEVHS
jgi:hypothetical protein